MKNNFIDDLEVENIEVANKILQDSERIETDDVYDENLINSIISKQGVKKKRINKTKIVKMASSVAACIIIFFTVMIGNSDINVNVDEKVIPEESTYIEKDEYEHIFERMKCVSVYTKKYYSGSGGDGNALAEMAGDVDTQNSSLSTNEYYNTNEQTENVHEGDIVKTDGRYIYTLTGDDNSNYKVIITKVNGDSLEIVSEIKLEEKWLEDIYVDNDKLIVIGAISENNEEQKTEENVIYDMIALDNQKTIIYVYDITDRKTPNLISKNTQDGSYVSSRYSENTLYTVSSKYMYEITKDKCVPEVNNKKMLSTAVYLPENIDSTEYTVITSLDVTNSKEFKDSVAIAGSANNLYASEDNIYLIIDTYIEEEITDTEKGKQALKSIKEYGKIYDNEKVKIKYTEKNELKDSYGNIDFEQVEAYKNTGVYRRTNATEIVKYNYNKGKIVFVADKIVEGSVDSSLSLDEKDGYLRFVTTQYSYIEVETRTNYYDKDGKYLFNSVNGGITTITEDTEETNNVIVLGSTLDKVAEIKNIAEGESIYSARYLGDYGYFVTYENTDPLFSVDFSDMENPQIIGELKMPGFSDYLHFYKEDLLFGLGVETDENNGDFECLKLEMYDVSNGKASKKSKYLIEKACYTPALYVYKTIMVDSKKELIGFSIEEEEKTQFHTYYVLYTYEDGEFRELMKTELSNKSNTSFLTRGFYIGDYLYIVNANEGIKVISLKDYKKVGEINF